METIRHFPCGTDPYGSCGYDRTPFHPLSGQQVLIRCQAEGTPAVRLRVRSDAGEQTAEGVPDSTFGSGCFLFRIGPFRVGERVCYTFCTASGETGPYPFTVRAPAVRAACTGLLAADGQAFLVSALPGGMTLTARIVANGTGFAFSAAQAEDAGGCAGAERCALETGDGFRLLLEREPFRARLLHPDGRVLLAFDSLSFELDEKNAVARFRLGLLAAGKGFYGFGEKFDRVNQKGLTPKNVVYEHFTRQGRHTYLPVPWMFTEAGWGLYCATACEADCDLSRERDGCTLVEIAAETGTGGLPAFYLLTGGPEALLRGFQRLTGPCALPPDWAFGPWMSANGWSTQKETLEQVEQMRRTRIPATVLVLEAWSDEATFYLFNGAHYTPKSGGAFSYADFTFDADGPWPDPAGMVRGLHEAGLHLVLWQIPVIKDAAGTPSSQLALDEREAVENGYCVKNADGTPYRIPANWFAGSQVLDFTNPDAVEWWFRKRRYLRDELHVDGFKTDGGEFLYDPSVRLYGGKTGADGRNPYPAAYAGAYYRFMRQGGRHGVVFSRAGYAGMQKSPLIWAGDQISTFEEMRAQLRAGLSAGLSGIPFWGFDLAGFAGELPSTELYLRAVGMAAFSPVMQFHSEPRSGQFGDSRRRSWINDRSPWNMAKCNDAPEILDIYRFYAQLRMRMLPYITREARFSAQTGRPLLCHLVYEYPDDAQVLDLEDEYLFGRSLLVAPIMEEHAGKRTVYLPESLWFDFWTGRPVPGGRSVEVACGLERIPVFTRDPACTHTAFSE